MKLKRELQLPSLRANLLVQEIESPIASTFFYHLADRVPARDEQHRPETRLFADRQIALRKVLYVHLGGINLLLLTASS